MKVRKQTCSRCKGSKRVKKLTRTGEDYNAGMYIGDISGFKMIECPNCEGTGEEVLISPNQWKEYQRLKKIVKAIPARTSNTNVNLYK